MPADTTLSGGLPRHESLTKIIVAATVGNVLEWFDFLVYGYFAVTIAEAFFPAKNATVSLLITFGTFGLSYLMRPLGAAVIGTYTDKHGRKAGLTLSIGLMMIGTALMVVTPGYATIGLAAPAIIMLARMLQGFSVGGEFGSAVAFLAEHGAERKGYSASWQWASTGLVSIVVALFGIALTENLSHEELVSWGWRVPYVFGLLVGPAGLYIRSKVVETEEFVEAKPHSVPLRALLSKSPDTWQLGRLDYFVIWLFTLVFGSAVSAMFTEMLYPIGVLLWLVTLGLQLWLAMTRLKDMGSSLWLCFLLLVPLVNLVLLFSLFFYPGTETARRENSGALLLLLALGASVVSNASYYLLLYIPTYAIKTLHLHPSTGFIATLVGGVALTIFSLLGGHLSDKTDRPRIMLWTAGLFFITAYPVFWLMVTYPSVASAAFAVGWLNMVKGGYSGVLPSLMSEQFPVETRAVGVAFSYSISVTIFGGFAPFFATWLIAQTGDPLSPSFYLMATALLSLIALFVIRRRSGYAGR